jgi:hypothetical protein
MRTLLAILCAISALTLTGCVADRGSATRSPEPVAKPTTPNAIDANPNIPEAAKKTLRNATGAPAPAASGN